MKVVLLHGFGENASIWDEFINLLPKEHNYLTPDFSFVSSCKTIDDYADWLKQELDNEQVSQCFIVGHSMGGYIALAFAEKYPTILKGICLLHSTTYADTDERKATRLKTADFIEKHGSAEFIKDFLPNMFNEEFKATNREYILNKIETYKQIPKEALIAATLAMRERPDRRNLLKTLKIPIQFIAGEKDKFIPLEASKEQIAILNYSKNVILEGIVHASMLENPELTAKVLGDFLGDV
ncbi:MAG: alpha/beta hydrolase [Spirosomaceae bacterium]|nr:alpha/beta hydrolase [Spirosomataceae bacterium]